MALQLEVELVPGPSDRPKAQGRSHHEVDVVGARVFVSNWSTQASTVTVTGNSSEWGALAVTVFKFPTRTRTHESAQIRNERPSPKGRRSHGDSGRTSVSGRNGLAPAVVGRVAQGRRSGRLGEENR